MGLVDTIGPLLAGVSSAAQARLDAAAGTRTVGKGAYLFLTGDDAAALYFVESGRIAIQRERLGGDVLTYVIHGPGAGFGEQSLINATYRRSASALALDRSRLHSVPFDVFESIRTEEPSVERLLTGILLDQVHRLSRHAVLAVYGSPEERLAHALEVLMDETISSSEVPVTQSELASLVGLTRPTTNQALQVLQDEGLLTLRRGRILIDRPEGVRERAALGG